jgi:hypothetical protein
MSSLLVGAVVRCSLPPPFPPQEPVPTRVRTVRGAFVSVPGGGTLDRPALVASLRQMQLTSIVIQTSADEAGQFVSERVSLAVELQRELDADVFIGTYQASAHRLSGKPMADLLQKDPAFASCYAPDGPRLDADATLIDKVRICSQDVAQKVADELARVGASPRIGCSIAHEPELVDALTADQATKLHALFVDAAAPCRAAKRNVAISPLLSNGSGDPGLAAAVLRDAIADTGINLVLLQDGVGVFDASAPRRASPYYDALRVAIAGRPVPVQIWANLEAFDCEAPGCVRTHPTDSARFISQVCGARARVENIVANEYLHDLAGRPLVTGDLDASPDLRAIADDSDAAAQLRRGYLDWVDSGASCTGR